MQVGTGKNVDDDYDGRNDAEKDLEEEEEISKEIIGGKRGDDGDDL